MLGLLEGLFRVFWYSTASPPPPLPLANPGKTFIRAVSSIVFLGASYLYTFLRLFVGLFIFSLSCQPICYKMPVKFLFQYLSFIYFTNGIFGVIGHDCLFIVFFLRHQCCTVSFYEFSTCK